MASRKLLEVLQKERLAIETFDTCHPMIEKKSINMEVDRPEIRDEEAAQENLATRAHIQAA